MAAPPPPPIGGIGKKAAPPPAAPAAEPDYREPCVPERANVNSNPLLVYSGLRNFQLGDKIISTTGATGQKNFVLALHAAKFYFDKSTDAVLIDRSPEHFQTILNYLRDGSVPLPKDQYKLEQLLAEAAFYKLRNLERMILTKLQAFGDWMGKELPPAPKSGKLKFEGEAKIDTHVEKFSAEFTVDKDGAVVPGWNVAGLVEGDDKFVAVARFQRKDGVFWTRQFLYDFTLAGGKFNGTATVLKSGEEWGYGDVATCSGRVTWA